MKTYPVTKSLLFVLLATGLSFLTSSCEKDEGRLKPVVRIDSVFNGSPGGFSVKVHVEPGKGDDGEIIAKGVVYHTFQTPELNNGETFQDVSGGNDFVVDVIAETNGYVRAYVILKDGTILYSEKQSGKRREYFSYKTFNGEDAMIVQGKVNNINLTGVYMNSSILVGASSTSDGEGNTAKIVANTIGAAANFCDDLELEGHTDWYLPALDEYLHAATELGWDGNGGVASSMHWTSTEATSNTAQAVSIFNGNTNIQPVSKFAFTFFTCMRKD